MIVQHLEAAVPLRNRTDGRRRCGRSSSSTRQARPRSVRRTTSPGSRIRPRRWTRSTASSRCYLDARGMKGAFEGLVFYVNREKTSEIQKLAARCPMVRRQDAVGSEIQEAGRPGDHGECHRRGHRDRRLGPVSRRSESICPTIRPFANATAASRSRCRTSTKHTTSRCCRLSAASSRGHRRKPTRATKWSALAGELTARTCTR